MTNLPAGRRSLEATEQQWQVVVEALIQVSTAWREVSPESQGPVNELLQDARSNVAYWRARSKGLDEREASCMLLRALRLPATSTTAAFARRMRAGEDLEQESARSRTRGCLSTT